ncbi:MAG: CHAD domain-containing protein [Planctomycetes bacterium]|nr:CHAD domain-containing protein [Planctomycetota bacterium]
MPPTLETEFKLRAAPAVEVAAVDAAVREAGASLREASTQHHVDVYLDDDRGALAAAGIGLRLRVRGDRRQLTAKTRGRRDGARFERFEYEAPWSQPTPPGTAAALPPPLRDLVEPFVLDHPLREVLRLATRRERRLVAREEQDLAELAIDHTTATARGRSVTFFEVELEAIDDVPACERLVEQLQRTLPLQPASDDKPGHASALLGLQGAPPADGAPTLAALLRQQLLALQQAEASVRSDGAPADVHALRVAARRLRELVRAFRDAWPKPVQARVRAALRELGHRLAAVRELDVLQATLPTLLERLPAPLRAAAPAVVDSASRQRRQLLDAARAWLASGERLDAQRQLQADLDAAAPPVSVATTARQRLASAVRRLQKRARRLPPTPEAGPVHELRIACKRVRYLLEVAAAAGSRAPAAAPGVARAQHELGLACDHEATTRMLLAWLPHLPAGAEALPAAALVGALAAASARRARKARRRSTRSAARLGRDRRLSDLLA